MLWEGTGSLVLPAEPGQGCSPPASAHCRHGCMGNSIPVWRSLTPMLCLGPAGRRSKCLLHAESVFTAGL